MREKTNNLFYVKDESYPRFIVAYNFADAFRKWSEYVATRANESLLYVVSDALWFPDAIELIEKSDKVLT